MPFARIRRFSGRVACCLCLLFPVLAGCGDYCLFCEGQGSGGGGGGDERTAEAGDLILADQFAGSIFIYKYEDGKQDSLLSGLDDVSGLALYSSEESDTCDEPFSTLVAYQQASNIDTIDTLSQQSGQPDRLSLAVVPKGMTFPYDTDQTDTDQTTTELLFFTVNTEDTLYIYDLNGATVLDTFDNPYPITNSDLGADFFESPTALAIDSDGSTATLFVLNDNGADSSVKRFSVDLEDWTASSPQEIGTMTETTWRLVDIVYYDQTDELFVSMKTEAQPISGGRVLVISSASERTRPVALESNSTTAFVARDYEITGLAVAPRDDQPGPAEFLSLRANEVGQVEQFDIDQGGIPETVFNFSLSYQFPQALAYDCTNERLLIADVPFNDSIPRTLFQAFPTQ